MGSETVNPVQTVLELIHQRKNFLLQGGAGSGKTESLKRVVQTLVSDDPAVRIACITHTNKAADEIQERVKSRSTVSTIHSFLASLIKPYGRNIQRVFPNLFILDSFEELGLEAYDGDEKACKKGEHDRFKKAHKTLTDRRKVVLDETTEKVTGKKEYDKNPGQYNFELNILIDEVNEEIQRQVNDRKASEFYYNETIFDNFHDPSFGHDGLLSVSSIMFEQFPLLGKLLSDRYDCIFIDEYQDTNSDIIRAFLQSLPSKKIVVGLFGDSEQAIYEDGIGSAQKYVDSGQLTLVEKRDNFRCSPQVIDVANRFRTDGLTQEIALKSLENGALESVESREGSAVFYYSIAPEIEDTGNEKSDKDNHSVACEAQRDALIAAVSESHPGHVQLKLTNKSIARDVGFGQLYDIFSNRYRDPRDRIKNTLDRLQFGEVMELVGLFQSLPGDRRTYNQLISKLRKRHFSIRSVQDKEKLKGLLSALVAEERGAYDTVSFAVDAGLIRRSDSHTVFLERRNLTLEELAGDAVFQEFSGLYDQGANTLVRMKKALPEHICQELNEELLDERFEALERSLRHKQFLERLFSEDLRFSEIIAYYRYEEDDATFATMHKTKGTGIENVMVVLDEYKWRDYDFLSCFSGAPPQTEVETSTQKLLYVACSRAKKNLVCVRLVEDQTEADRIAAFFPSSKCIELETQNQATDAATLS